MSNRKTHNSIIFLTTLSVYLSLSLLGAAPQVLAYAATTRDFDVQTEIEYKDDLDNKPDNELLDNSILEIVKDLDKLAKSNKFEWKKKSSFTVEGLNFCESDDSPSYEGSENLNNKKAREIVDERVVQIGRNLSKLRSDFGLGDFYYGFPEGITSKLLTENKALNLEIQIKIKDEIASQKFFDSINSLVSQKKSLAENSKSALIYENTKVSFRDNQIFIVTNLPRAAIDSLIQ